MHLGHQRLMNLAVRSVNLLSSSIFKLGLNSDINKLKSKQERRNGLVFLLM